MSSEMLSSASDYTSERTRMLRLLEGAGATIQHHKHPLRGPSGEELWMDVGRIGAPPSEATCTLVVSSGTHGVEGHTGSALQALALESGLFDDLEEALAVVIIHAVNPYGMAWDRRVDHQNIDVNRNFVSFDGELPKNPGYSDLARVMNDIADPFVDGWAEEILTYAAVHGSAEMFRAVSGGQYHTPSGMQFGGTGPCWSRVVLESVWAEHLGGSQEVIHIDIHTGLGPFGSLIVFQTADAEEPAAEISGQTFAGLYRSDRTTAGGHVQSGVLGPGMDLILGDVPLVIPVVAEFGTLDEMLVFAAMRADNWLHNLHHPISTEGDQIRVLMRQAFAPDDPEWLRKVAESGIATLRSALETLAQRLAGSS